MQIQIPYDLITFFGVRGFFYCSSNPIRLGVEYSTQGPPCTISMSLLFFLLLPSLPPYLERSVLPSDPDAPEI